MVEDYGFGFGFGNKRKQFLHLAAAYKETRIGDLAVA